MAGTDGGDGGPAVDAELSEVSSIHFGAGSHTGDLYIADTENNRIRAISASGGNEWASR